MLAAVVMSAGLAMAATAPKAAPKAAKPAVAAQYKPVVKPSTPKFVGRAWTAKPKKAPGKKK